MIKHLKLFIIPYSIVFTWISFAFLDLKGSDGNIGLLQEGTSVLYEKFESKNLFLQFLYSLTKVVLVFIYLQSLDQFIYFQF